MVKFAYYGNKKTCCITVAYERYTPLTGEGDRVQIGMAFMKKGDTFNKKRARQIAEGRMRKPNTTAHVTIPWEPSIVFKAIPVLLTNSIYFGSALHGSLAPPNTKEYRKLTEHIAEALVTCGSTEAMKW